MKTAGRLSCGIKCYLVYSKPDLKIWHNRQDNSGGWPTQTHIDTGAHIGIGVECIKTFILNQEIVSLIERDLIRFFKSLAHADAVDTATDSQPRVTQFEIFLD